jgi:hypothetical protein
MPGNSRATWLASPRNNRNLGPGKQPKSPQQDPRATWLNDPPACAFQAFAALTA